MASKYKFEVAGVDYSSMVERDSYSTSLTPVYSQTVTTMDGISHMVKVRTRGSLAVTLNPQTAEQTQELCTALLKTPVEVLYHCLQRDMDVYATMYVDALSATFLSRCLAGGQRWNDMQSITLQEL